MKIAFAILVLTFVVFPSSSHQQGCAISLPAEAPMTVSVDWLGQNINNSKIVLLHIGTKEEYDAGHIAGAQFIPLNDISLGREESDLAVNDLPTETKRKPRHFTVSFRDVIGNAPAFAELIRNRSPDLSEKEA